MAIVAHVSNVTRGPLVTKVIDFIDPKPFCKISGREGVITIFKKNKKITLE